MGSQPEMKKPLHFDILSMEESSNFSQTAHARGILQKKAEEIECFCNRNI